MTADPQTDAMPALDSERQFFDHLVSAEGEFDPFHATGWQALKSAFLALSQITPVASILDVGCGTGSSRQLYADVCRRYVGMDLSPKSIEIAKRSSPSDEWLVGDACAMSSFDDQVFDLVAFSSVLHHLPSMPAALSEAFRVLKPGGTVFAFDPNLLNPAMALLRHPSSPLYHSEGVSPNEKPLLPKTLRRVFADAGFTDIRQRAKSGIAYRQVGPAHINKGLRLFNIADSIWERLGPGRWFGTFILTLGRKPT